MAVPNSGPSAELISRQAAVQRSRVLVRTTTTAERSRMTKSVPIMMGVIGEAAGPTGLRLFGSPTGGIMVGDASGDGEGSDGVGADVDEVTSGCVSGKGTRSK